MDEIDLSAFSLKPISYSDEAFVSMGLGLFETMKIVIPDENAEPRVEYLTSHIKRLLSGVRALLPEVTPPNVAELEKAVNFYLRNTGRKQGALKLVLAAANFGRIRVLLSYDNRCYDRKLYQDGVSLKLLAGRRNSYSRLNGWKTLSNMENMLELHAVRGEGFMDGIYLNEKNEVAEGTISNIFWLKQGMLYTPALECGLLPGIMRQGVIKKALSLGMKVKEGHFPLAELTQAEGVFITNSLMGCMPVSSIVLDDSRIVVHTDISKIPVPASESTMVLL